ncbi:hypothetical protein A7985_07880 [Pseudoalteromonas luteoviolacea]|uniref:SMI1/KNR4 family protein n=1 Tax=Pseudoalteromonas luteoviolacea TaxID=43657 RepID=A0A1C0TX02_9GAMM|nr:hypothetical protein [Pseudoalteromonas luteoviolacea]OCQ23848.1 hypothetical protein A7985_07880 [Pseudoalteromonas luteoviolacea]
MKISKNIEKELGIALPEIYKSKIDTQSSDTGLINYIFHTNAETIVNANYFHIHNYDEVPKKPSLWGALIRFLIGSSAKEEKKDLQFFKKWKESKVFIIGRAEKSVFYIELNDPNCSVYEFDFDVGKVIKKFNHIDDFITFTETN